MIYISEKAKDRVVKLMEEKNLSPDEYFLRVSVQSGGCSGLSYKMDFENELKPKDQEFEDKGIKLVTDLKSFLYLVNTTLEFSDGLNGKGFYFNNPNASRSCACGESFSV
ncbi:MAG TPA: iron-sulfur cluster assembly accessory protein [Hanamia sp.]|jgi:iron-sulfur cluster assembly protein|nr:iron-sulfur cluster assembly accessory protein [Hanamia sp.]HZI69389.1 iron-sulfur cluster assembly accessory protein [Hanamia sp.]